MSYKLLVPNRKGSLPKRKPLPVGTVRRLKIVAHRVPSRQTWNRVKCVPHIRLSGVWLESAGFCVGDEVEVLTGKGKIVLTVAGQEITGCGEAGESEEVSPTG